MAKIGQYMRAADDDPNICVLVLVLEVHRVMKPAKPLFGLGEDLDRVKRLNEMGVTRVVPMFPPEKADTVLPIVDRWTNVMRQVNG